MCQEHPYFVLPQMTILERIYIIIEEVLFFMGIAVLNIYLSFHRTMQSKLP